VARDLFDLTGRRALVTGGGRGLGRGMAEALAGAGAAVALVGRSEQVEDTARELGGVAVRADLAVATEREAAFERAVDELGGLDVLVTAHGTTRRAPDGVNVNAIAPGYFRTELTAPLWRDDPERNAEILARLPAGRWGEPADLAGAVVFLCSSASDYVHDTVLPVDGGWLAR
jgi:NAD(P)-dependent dehydrogenase (short-subunit alcohol dehydrogenase family)